MHYILLDFEWDCFYCHAIDGFVNEILQIGAVKLNDDFQQIGKFSVDICSTLSTKLSGRFKRLTGITNEQMRAGIPLKEALLAYKKWAGEEAAVTFTWSDTDLHVLHKNCALFLKDTAPAHLGYYADLQKIFHAYLAQQGTPQTNQISLENAAIMLHIPFSESNLHRALDDSALSALILSKCAPSINIQSFVRDTNQAEFYQRLLYKPHYINSISDKHIDPAALKAKCERCGKSLQRLTKWRYINGWFRADFYCSNCHLKVNFGSSFKQYYDHVVTRQRFFTKPKSKFLKNTAASSSQKNQTALK